jgi:hypothetical protein
VSTTKTNRRRKVIVGTTKKSVRPMSLQVTGQEGLPGLRRRLWLSDHIFRDGRLSNVDTEFEQFTVDAGSAPERVGNAHMANKITRLFGNVAATKTYMALPSPVKAETVAMPGDDGGWPDNDQC